MEVKIGIQSIQRELVVDTSGAPEDIEKSLRDAVADGELFTLTDENGGRILIPSGTIGYVEINRGEQRRVGFGNP